MHDGVLDSQHGASFVVKLDGVAIRAVFDPDAMRVYDFSNPVAPVFIQNMEFYQDQGYNHQGWLTPDGTRYFFGDESNGRKLKECSINNNYQLSIERTFGTNFENNSVAHNIMATNEFVFVAYYNEGLRIFDIQGFPKEIAHYDTYPTEHFYKLNGAWGIYSMLPSERLLVSDRQHGLFLFRFDRSVFLGEPDEVAVYPTLLQTGSQVTIRLENGLSTALDVRLIDLNGNVLQDLNFYNQSYGRFIADVPAGMYFVEVSYTDYLNDVQRIVKKVMVF